MLSHPPQDNTLTICDGRSVPASDAAVVEALVSPKGVPGSQFKARICKYRPDHRWYYFSNMYPHEMLVFKGYDSEIPRAMNAMHTAFDNPSAGPNAIPRESIEARFFVLRIETSGDDPLCDVDGSVSAFARSMLKDCRAGRPCPNRT